MNRILAASLAAPLFFVLAACSGASATFTGADDGGGGGGGDGGTDGSPNPDGGSTGACPANAPTAGQACTTPGLNCEFGGSGNHRLCTTTAICLKGSSGVTAWIVTPPSPSCIGTPDQNPNACPASFTTLPTGSACPKQGLSCVYDQGMCGCIPCIGDSGGVGSQQEWACDPYPTPSGCPEPRPLIGSACTQEGQSCNYGELCGVVSGPSLGCQNGHWASQPTAASCAIHQCGK